MFRPTFLAPLLAGIRDRWKPLGVAFLLLACGCMFLPREIEIAPAWSVKVFSPNGEPEANARVTQNWQFFGLLSGNYEDSDSLLTDAQGGVSFSARFVRASTVSMVMGRFISCLNVHASFGPNANVNASPTGCKHLEASYFDNGKSFDSCGSATSKEQGGFVTVFHIEALDLVDHIQNLEWGAAKTMLATDMSLVNFRSRDGITPLIALTQSKSSGPRDEVLRLLLTAGADVNAQANDGTTALHNVTKNCELSLLKLLLSKGADPNVKIHNSVYYTTNGYTPIFFVFGGYSSDFQRVAPAEKIEAIDSLLAHGADINAKESQGFTPLHLAREWGDPAIIAAMAAKGATDE